MKDILLLYDMNERDFIRDFKDLLEEVNIGPISMIPLSPDRGLTLEAKEKEHFKSAEGAIFIITPGSERLGGLYPSPSVSHEMGQAKQKFQEKPECVIYLVDQNCSMPSIDQQAYITFDRKDARSILSALIQLVKDLKEAGLYRTTPIPDQVETKPKKIDLRTFTNTLNPQIKNVLFDMSNKPSSYISDKDLTSLLSTKYGLDVQAINFLKRDLEAHSVVQHTITTKPCYFNSWWLSELGWSVVRLEIHDKKKAEPKALKTLASLLAKRPQG